MKAVRYLFMILCSQSTFVDAQLWEPLAGGTSYLVQTISEDTSIGHLYFVGQFKYASDTLVNGIGSWDGHAFRCVGGGILDSPNCVPSNYGICHSPTSIFRFENEIFVGGSFDALGGTDSIKDLARWDGIRWQDCGPHRNGLSFDECRDDLFGFGIIHDGNDAPVQTFGRWNGQEFERFGTHIPFSDYGAGPYCVEFYKGEYYFGGNFEEPNGLVEIMRWNGSEWNSLQSGVLGDGQVSTMKVFKGQLFVGGPFYQAAGNPSDNFMAWDGNQWYNPLPEVQFISQVNYMEVIDGSLYIVARYFVFGDNGWEGPYGIAKWDGVEFCAFGGRDIYPKDVAGVNGEIYVTGGLALGLWDSLGAHGDTIKYLGHWIGGDSVDICISQTVRVVDPISDQPIVQLFPNPAYSTFTLTLPPTAGSCTIRIRDITGRQVGLPLTYHAGDAPVDVAALPSGLYFVEVSTRGKTEVIKLVKQ